MCSSLPHPRPAVPPLSATLRLTLAMGSVAAAVPAPPRHLVVPYVVLKPRRARGPGGSLSQSYESSFPPSSDFGDRVRGIGGRSLWWLLDCSWEQRFWACGRGIRGSSPWWLVVWSRGLSVGTGPIRGFATSFA
jgi:hypothetical protein